MDRRYSFWRKTRLLLNQISPGRGRFGQIFVTTKCNLRCDYCQVTQRTTKDIPPEHWQRIVEKMIQWGVSWFSITGGEPLLRKDLEEIISFISGRNRITSLVSNGALLTQARIDALAEAGLCFLTVSLDSLGTGGAIKSNSERVFELLDYAKGKGIVPEIKKVVNPGEPAETTIRLAEETTRRGFVFAVGLLQAVGGLFSKPSRFSPVIGGMARKENGVWLPVECFQKRPGIGATWKCNPETDAWITVDNNGTLMPCQEWGSEIPVLEISGLDNPAWREHKEKTVRSCPGCYYDCYYQQDCFYHRWLKSLRELPRETHTLRGLWNLLH